MRTTALMILMSAVSVTVALAYPPAHIEAHGASTTSAWATPTSLPAPRASAAVAVGRDGSIYVFGGWTGTPDNNRATNTTFIFNPRSATWSQGTTMPHPLEGAAAVTLKDGRIAVLGGSTVACSVQSCGPIQRAVQIYNPTTHAWRSMASMHSPRYRFAATLGPDGRIYAIGGFDGHDVTASVEAYDPRKGSWQEMTRLPQPEQGEAATVARGRIVVIGGSDGGTSFYNDVFVYDGHSWNSGSPMPTPRSDLGITTTATGKIIAIGGYRPGRFLATVQVYDPWADSWATVSPLPHDVSEVGAVRLSNGLIYALGGYTGSAPSTQVAVYGGVRRNPFTALT